MPDGAMLIQQGSLNLAYLEDWCGSREGRLIPDHPGGCHRLFFSGPAGVNKRLFWLPRLEGRGADRPIEAKWSSEGFAGPEAWLPGMLSVLLTVVAEGEWGAEIVISLGDAVPEGLDPRRIYYFLMPTDFQLVLAHKGEYEVMVELPGVAGGYLGQQGAYESESLFVRDLEDALAPAHPVYPVGPEAPALVRPYFLLGHRQAVLSSLARNEKGLALTYRLNTFPGDGPDEVTAHFRDALARAGRPEAGLRVRLVHAGGKSSAGPEELEPLYRAFESAIGTPPDVDWYTWPSPAGDLCHKGYKTAAFGPGRYSDYLAGAVFDRTAGKKLELILRALMARDC